MPRVWRMVSRKVGEHSLITLGKKSEHVVFIWVPIAQDADNRGEVVDRASLELRHHLYIENPIDVGRTIANALPVNLTTELAHQERVTTKVLDQLCIQHFVKP